MNERLTPLERIRKKSDFSNLYREGGRFRGQVATDVEFQLFDNRTDEVVYSVTYRGQAEYPEFRESGNLGTLIAASFRDAAAQFAADPEVLARAGT